MYRNTRFSALLEALPRGLFDRLTQTYGTDKYSKRFRSWDQFVAMLYGQLSGCSSLRTLEAEFNSQANRHYHLGCRPMKRTTLADANTKRDSTLYKALCDELMSQVHRHCRQTAKAQLHLIDSTPIRLCGTGYDEWTDGHKNARHQGLKVHIMTAVRDANAPIYVEMTTPNVNDIEVGKHMPIEPGVTYVFDKGYYDYSWWHQIHKTDAYFVTRFKKNAGLDVVATQPIHGTDNPEILQDETVRFKHARTGKSGRQTNAYHGTPLRRIIVERPDKETPLVLATNDFERTAEEIADLYKQRWEIELFFKWLKQNLKLKTFLGRNENAVKTQIYIALIAYLLVYALHRKEGVALTLSLFLSTLRAGLFQRLETDAILEKRRRQYDQIQPELGL